MATAVMLNSRAASKCLIEALQACLAGCLGSPEGCLNPQPHSLTPTHT